MAMMRRNCTSDVDVCMVEAMDRGATLVERNNVRGVVRDAPVHIESVRLS